MPFGDTLGSRLGQARVLVRLVVNKSIRDGIQLKSAALAFVTLISLIPLIAALSFVGRTAFDRNEDRILDTLSEILPYSEEAIVDQIQLWVAQAESLTGFGALAFLLVALFGFITIEDTINRIWEVGSRTLKSKFLSFTLLIFWGPIVIGTSYSVLIYLRTRPGLSPLLDESIIGQIFPFLATLLGLTMLYWQVPHSSVNFRHAFRGGLLAALLLELLRRGFAFWVLNFSQWQYVVYGSVALAFLFMLSVQFSWWIVLLGCETAYVSQHAEVLILAGKDDARWSARWVGLAVLLELTLGLRDSRPMQGLDELGRRVRISPPLLRRSIEPLIAAGRICLADDGDKIALGFDPGQLTLEKALEPYEQRTGNLIQSLPEPLAELLGPLAEASGRRQGRSLEGQTLASLLDTDPIPANEGEG